MLLELGGGNWVLELLEQGGQERSTPVEKHGFCIGSGGTDGGAFWPVGLGRTLWAGHHPC